MTLAEVMLQNNEPKQALEVSLRLQESLARGEQYESQWQAWLIAARASRRVGDKPKACEYGQHASDVLDKLQQGWGTEAFKSYLNRPDIQNSCKQLGQVLRAYR
ncbi:MAG: hypothetical protein DMG06_21540 [Acidobacteria bacterium]|nr:MAG: hypothetical protein DMG06_21540 [Acidobacteriota bacterium]